MPYNKITDLPDWVKKAFPDNVQEAYRNAFNSAYAKYKEDGKAAAVAISAVQKMGYVKKGDKWIKAEYVKDLGLKPGTYLHPNEDGKELNITEQNLIDYVTNTQKVIDGGGMIPVTISHPKDERDKIELNEGDIVGVWYDAEEQVPYMAFNPSALVKGWIDGGKLKAVSPGIYHDVVTSIGKLPSLIDHVALTNSPFNIQQSGFMPVTAEKFGKAVLFFENKYISHEQGGDVLEFLKPVQEGIIALYDYVFGKEKTRQGGEMLELERANSRIIELEAQEKTLKGDIADRDKTILDQGEKIDKYEKSEKERIETEETTAIETFTAKVDQLIKELKVKPENKTKMVDDFTTLYKNKIEDADKILLERFGDTDPVKNILKQDEIKIGTEIIDIKSPEANEKIADVKVKLARQMAEKKNIPAEKYMTCYEAASNAIDEKIAKGEAIEL